MKYGLNAILCWMFIQAVAAQNIQVSFVNNQPACNGYTNGSVTANPSGGVGAYTYIWNTGQAGQTLFGIGAGTYSVTVTDQNGASAVGSSQVGQPTALTANITGSGFNCTPQGVLSVQTSGGTAPYTYLWSNNASSSTISVSTAGFYYITVTDAQGCSKVDDYYVTPSLVVDVVPTNIPCPNFPNTGAVFAAVAGGATPYAFVWSNNSTSQGQQNVAADTYTVTVTDANGCTSADAGTVTIPAPITVAITINAPACGGNNGSVTLQASGGTGPYTYNWTSIGQGVTGATMNNLAPGNYYVCVFDANMCQNDINVVVPESSSLQVQLIITKAECPGVNTGTAFAQVFPPGNYIYSWDPPQGGSFAQINNLAAGTQVSVTVTDPVTGCLGTATGYISAHNQVAVSVTDVDIPCLGQQTGSASAIASLGTAPYNYEWYSGANVIGTGPNINNLNVGAYMVSVTDDRGCTAVGVADITALSGPVADFNMAITDCPDTLVGVQFTDASTDAYSTITAWQWTIQAIGGSGSQVFNSQAVPVLNFLNQQQVIVQLQVTSATGCISTVIDTVTIKGFPDYLINVNGPLFTCENLPVPVTVLGDTTYTYTWFPTTGLTLNPNAQNIILNPAVTTTYHLIVSNGLCPDTSAGITIKRAIPINLQVTAENVIACTPNMTITATANAAAGATVVWYENGNQVGTGLSLNILTAGVHLYTAVASDSLGCTDTVSVQVTGQTVDVQIEGSGTVTACENTPVQVNILNLDPTDILTYQWTGPNGISITPANTANPLVQGPAGTYVLTVTATNQFACSTSVQVSVIFEPIISLQGQVTADLCNGLEVQFANLSGISGVWNFGDNTATSTENNPMHVYSAAGAYQVVFTPNIAGCYEAFDSLITVLSSDAIQAGFVSALDDCTNGAVIAFTDTTNHLNPIQTWVWNFPNGVPGTSTSPNPAITYVTSGNFIVTLAVTDVNGCTSTITDTIEVIGIPDYQVNVLAPTFTCDNQPVPVTVSGASTNTYTWFPNTGLTLNPDGQNILLDPDVTTTYFLVVNQGICSDTSAAITIKRAVPINLDLGADNVIACEPNMVLTATANAAAGATVVWYENGVQVGTGFTLNILTAGIHTYTAIATDAEGCKDTAVVQVTGESVNVQIEGAGTVTACENTPVQINLLNLDPTDILSYQWSAPAGVVINPQNVANPTVQGPAGTYVLTVTATNQFTCTATTTVTVVFNPAASLEAQISADLCNGLEVQFTNTSGVTGTWNFGDNTPLSTQTNPLHTYASAGAYTISFIPSNAACFAAYDSVINVLPTAAIQASFAATLEDCSDDALIAFQDNSLHVNPIQSWSWVFNNGQPSTGSGPNPSTTYSTAGTFTATLVVTDINGCTSEFSLPVQVDLVNESLSEIMKICPEESVQLNPQFSQNYTYQWTASPNDPSLNATSPNPVVSPNVTTTYKVLVSNGLCTAEYTAIVEVKPAATVDITDMPGVVCSDDPVAIYVGATNSSNLVWDNEPGFNQPTLGTGTSIVVNPVANGVYYVLAEIDGCVAVDSIKINNAGVDIDLFASDIQICKGNSVSLEVTNLHPNQNLAYSWSPSLDPVSNPFVTPTQNTTYIVTASYLNCVDTDTITVRLLDLTVDAAVIGEVTILPSETTSLLATTVTNGTNVSYVWIPDTGLSDPFAPNPIVTFQPDIDSIQYCVIATTGQLCPDTACVQVNFRGEDCGEPYVFIPTTFTPNNDSNNDFFMVRGANITELRFIVWSRWGEKVYETTDVNATGWDGTWKGQELTPDSYAWYLKIRCGSGAEYETKGDVTLLK